MSTPASREEITRVVYDGPFSPDWPSFQGMGGPISVP